jgi:DNA-binding XRE family transcriptional regulator
MTKRIGIGKPITELDFPTIWRVKYNPAPLIALRKQLGYSMHQLAQAINTSVTNISRWESGTIPPNIKFVTRYKLLALMHGIVDFDPLSEVRLHAPPKA